MGAAFYISEGIFGRARVFKGKKSIKKYSWIGRYWSVLVGIGRYWLVLVGIGWYWSVLVGIGRYWSVLVGIG